MAIYRPPRSPWRVRLWAAAIGLLIGGAIVWALLPEGEPSEAERAAAVRTELMAAKGGLEIVAIEYAESVEDGEVVAQAEYEGAQAALARSRARFESVRSDLGDGAAEIKSAYDVVDRAVNDLVAEDELQGLLQALTRSLIEGASL